MWECGYSGVCRLRWVGCTWECGYSGVCRLRWVGYTGVECVQIKVDWVHTGVWVVVCAGIGQWMVM